MMAIRDFVRKLRDGNATATQALETAVVELASDVRRDRHRPTHIPDQREYIREYFDTDDTVWLFFFDGGRYDVFDQVVWDYFDGHLERVWNGGVSYTGDWCMRNLRGDYGNRGVFSYLPLRGTQDVTYDDRQHFAAAPDPRAEISVNKRLAALGYRERVGTEELDISPGVVNESVRDHATELDGGVIRYLKPHPPFTGMEELTSGSGKNLRTQQALDDGDLTYAQLTDAYIETYREAFDAAVSLIPKLEGRIVVTADHGECLTCGQLFHSRGHEKHDHLTVVPWFEVDRLT